MAAEQLFQIGIKAVIQNTAGDILLLAIPKWGDKPEHWDFPGGRMEPGEDFIQTLRREMQEEINVDYNGPTEHIATTLSNITIPVGDQQIPLVLIAYRVELLDDTVIQLDPNGVETEFAWFSPTVAAEHLERKYPPQFCKLIGAL